MASATVGKLLMFHEIQSNHKGDGDKPSCVRGPGRGPPESQETLGHAARMLESRITRTIGRDWRKRTCDTTTTGRLAEGVLNIGGRRVTFGMPEYPNGALDGIVYHLLGWF